MADDASPRVSVSTKGGASFDARVVRAQVGEIVAAFPFDSCPLLCIADDVSLAFSVDGTLDGRETKGRVIARHERERSREFHFRVSHDISSSLIATLGLRDDYRLTPDAGSRMEAMISAGGKKIYRTLVKDLSTTGAGILVDAATDRELVDTENVHIELRLFGADDEGVQLRGRIVHRKLLGSSVKHGIVFDTQGTPGFERKEKIIRSWINGRQADRLRRRRALKRA